MSSGRLGRSHGVPTLRLSAVNRRILALLCAWALAACVAIGPSIEPAGTARITPLPSPPAAPRPTLVVSGTPASPSPTQASCASVDLRDYSQQGVLLRWQDDPDHQEAEGLNLTLPDGT